MFTTVSVIVIILSWYLFRKVAGSMKPTRLNMVSWIFYAQLVVFSFIGSVLVVNGWVDDYYLAPIIGKDARFYGWLAIQYTMIAMPLSMLFINYLHGRKSNIRFFHTYINSPVVTITSKKDSYILFPLYLCSFLSLATVIYTFALMKEIPIYRAFQGVDTQTLALLRMETFMKFEGSETARKLLGVTLTPILSYVAYGYWRLTKLRIHLLWFLTMFVLSFFILTYNIAKAPFIFYIMGFLFLNVLTNGYIRKRTFFYLISFSAALIIMAYFIFMGVSNFEKLFEIMWHRILLGQVMGTFLSFEYFPAMHDYIGFSSFLRFLPPALGLDTSERAFRVIMEIMNPGAVADGTAGVVTSLYIQEAWANFGILGVIIAPLYVGMFVQIVYLYLLKFKKTPLSIGVLAYLSYKMPITSGFYHFIFDDALMFIFVFFIMVYVTALTLKKFKKQEAYKKRIKIISYSSHLAV